MNFFMVTFEFQKRKQTIFFEKNTVNFVLSME